VKTLNIMKEWRVVEKSRWCLHIRRLLIKNWHKLTKGSINSYEYLIPGGRPVWRVCRGRWGRGRRDERICESSANSEKPCSLYFRICGAPDFFPCTRILNQALSRTIESRFCLYTIQSMREEQMLRYVLRERSEAAAQSYCTRLMGVSTCMIYARRMTSLSLCVVPRVCICIAASPLRVCVRAQEIQPGQFPALLTLEARD
jgi:hypothetical protein